MQNIQADPTPALPDAGSKSVFMSGGGVTGELFRSLDWSTHPLGPAEQWPAALRTMLNLIFASRQPMFVWWGPRLIQFYNDAYLPSFGKGKHPAAMGQPGLDCWPEIWPIIGPQIEGVMSLGEATWHEDQLVPIFRNGRIEDVYWTYGYSPILDAEAPGGVGGVLVTCTETTHRVLSRLEVERTVSQLRSERELRERFVAALSHDLRTPLTAARIGAELLARKAGESPELRKIAGRIVGNMDRADQMIRDLLDVGRINAGERISLVVQPCDLVEVARAALEELATILGDRFVIQAAGPVRGRWDAGALRRVIENLAANAVKYGAPAAPVTVRVSGTADSAELSVHNQGEVIAEDQIPRLFAFYQRSDSAVRGAQKGWGIGLMLVHGLVEAHGGKIHVESERESGTTFRVTLPRAAL